MNEVLLIRILTEVYLSDKLYVFKPHHNDTIVLSRYTMKHNEKHTRVLEALVLEY